MELNTLERMKLALKRTGKTQQHLAEASGISVSSVGNYLSGDRVIPTDTEAKMWAAIRLFAAERAAAIRRQAEEEARRVTEPVGVAA